jgi:anti-sigma regulatory factor (Ser/Thr protein kinase)
MTQVARPAPERLDAFTLPSEPGNERLALARVAGTVQGRGLSDARLERLKTAVAEATMNAIEHGNGNHPEIPVEVEVTRRGDDITVAISDQGGRAHREAGRRPEPARLGAVPHPQHGRRDGRNDRRSAAHHLADHAHDSLTQRTGAAHDEHV